MEFCMEARALKSSFLSEIASKTTTQVLIDDVWCVAGINSDDFSVDDLLDFSDKDFKDGSVKELEEHQEKTSVSPSSLHRKSNSSTFSTTTTDDLASLSAAEFGLPDDELDNLEWLSQIVDDSVPGVSLLFPAGSFMQKTGSFPANRCSQLARPPVRKTRVPCFPSPVPGKARSKRSRQTGKVWSLASPSPSLSSESASPSSSNGSSSVLFMNPVFDNDLLSTVEKPAKRQKRKPATEPGSVPGVAQMLRRCSHCLVQKTPQWRAGPLGPKTLCNACGVRYKSGRLFPEYRPACSPTFSQEMHSNSHRKVLEMRKKKELTGFPEAGLTSMVPTF